MMCGGNNENIQYFVSPKIFTSLTLEKYMCHQSYHIAQPRGILENHKYYH